MMLDNGSTRLLVTLEHDGDIRSRRGRTQRFQSVEFHSQS